MIQNMGLRSKQKSETSKEAARQQWNPRKQYLGCKETPKQKKKYRNEAEEQKETEGINFAKILRIAAIAAAKASKPGWPSLPRGVKCKEDPVSTKATQEIVIRIFSNACAEAAQACRDQINKAYPGQCEEIIAAKIRQIDEEDSSTDNEVISKNLRKEPGPNTLKIMKKRPRC